MNQKNNETLKFAKNAIIQESVVKGIEDLNVGDVIYYDMDKADGIIPTPGFDSRLKYVVVSGSKSNGKEICAVLINSDNDYSAAADWQKEQLPILSDDYPTFLDHDSWIDCTDLKKIKVTKLKSKRAEKRGHLKQDDIDKVLKHLRENDFIDEHSRKVFRIKK